MAPFTLPTSKRLSKTSFEKSIKALSLSLDELLFFQKNVSSRYYITIKKDIFGFYKKYKYLPKKSVAILFTKKKL